MLNRKGSILAPLANELDSSRKASILNNSMERRGSILFANPPVAHMNRGPRKSIFLSYGRRGSYMSRKSSLFGLPKIKLQNTYRTEITDSEKFSTSLAEPKMREVLEEALKDQVYNASNSNILCKEISQDIMRELRNMDSVMSQRYKLVSHVSIGELKGFLF